MPPSRREFNKPGGMILVGYAPHIATGAATTAKHWQSWPRRQQVTGRGLGRLSTCVRAQWSKKRFCSSLYKLPLQFACPCACRTQVYPEAVRAPDSPSKGECCLAAAKGNPIASTAFASVTAACTQFRTRLPRQLQPSCPRSMARDTHSMGSMLRNAIFTREDWYCIMPSWNHLWLQ